MTKTKCGPEGGNAMQCRKRGYRQARTGRTLDGLAGGLADRRLIRLPGLIGHAAADLVGQFEGFMRCCILVDGIQSLPQFAKFQVERSMVAPGLGFGK